MIASIVLHFLLGAITLDGVTGVLLTMVNGIVPYRNGEFTHRRGGRFLEKI